MYLKENNIEDSMDAQIDMYNVHGQIKNIDREMDGYITYNIEDRQHGCIYRQVQCSWIDKKYRQRDRWLHNTNNIEDK